MKLPTQDEIDSLLRHVYTAAGTTLTIGTLLAVGPQDAVAPALAALHSIGDGLQQVFGGVSKLVVIFGPVVVALSAKAAAFAVSLKSQISKVHAAAPQELIKVVANQAPTVLAKATAALPGVQVAVSGNAPAELRVLAADPGIPDIVRAPAPPAASPATPLQKN